MIEDVLGQLFDRLTARRAERVTETLTDAAEELGGDTAEQLRRFTDAAASDETYQELLARALIIAQDTVMRHKRRPTESIGPGAGERPGRRRRQS